MIQNLLTALGVAALSIQTPNNITHEEPKRAYYDSSAVAEYGTTQNGLYNYTSYYMGDGETDGNLGDPPITFSYGDYETATGFNGTNLELGDYQMVDIYFFSSIPSNGMCANMSSALKFDLYVNGVYQRTLEPSLTDDDVYSFRIPSNLFTEGSYGWIFDYYEPPRGPYYSQEQVQDYGTTANKTYNYTGTTLYVGGLYNGETLESSSYPWADGENRTSQTSTNGDSTYLAIKRDSSAYPPQQYFVSAERGLSIQVYKNGAPLGIYDLTETPNGKYAYYIELPEGEPSTSYYWIFKAPIPLNPTPIAEVVGDATTAAAAVIGSGISGVISLFYNDGITGLGILSLIMAGVALVWFALSLVMKLWRRR